jgi:serine/threonine protein kinase
MRSKSLSWHLFLTMCLSCCPHLLPRAAYSPQHFAEIVGTPFYMAPEVLERCYGPAADVWSVGVVIYLMIAGCLPFNGNSDRQIIKAVMDSEPDFSGDVWQGVSQQGREFIQLMLIKDPRKRASIEQLLAHPWMAGRAGSVSGESCGQHASGSSSSSTSAAAGAAEAADAVTSTAAPVADCSSSSSASCPSSAVAAADSSSCNSGKQQCCSQQQQVQGSGQAPAAAGAPEVSAVAASPRLAVATGSKVSMR